MFNFIQILNRISERIFHKFGITICTGYFFAGYAVGKDTMSNPFHPILSVIAVIILMEFVMFFTKGSTSD